MGKDSLHGNAHNSTSPNQNNAMSEDPDDGDRESFVTGKDGSTPVEKAPPGDAHDEATIEDFGKRGLGVGAKE